ncbi:hypothetical protein V1477_015049 [Vespula maculifrons]|uniref:Uncharacterized protein n=1 Tax=Vespula maculifrons TaxID=7453 RepID=A0ABD2BJ64_VESMC
MTGRVLGYFYRVGPMNGSHLFHIYTYFLAPFGYPFFLFFRILSFSRARMFQLSFLFFLFCFSSSSWISIYRLRSDVSSNGSVYIRLLDANTGRIERTLARVSAGTGVVFSGAIKSPTVMDFV